MKSHSTSFLLVIGLLVISAVSGQQLSRAMHGVNLKRSHSFLNHPPPPEILALWIDSHQVEKVTGMYMEVDIIRRGMVNYQLKSIQDYELPTLPHDVDYVQLNWVAEKETFRYSFSKMVSLNPDILYDPLLSIPSSGDVPKIKSVFGITIPCTNNKTGIGTLYVELNITNSMYQPIQGSPLQFRVRKKCFGNNGSCDCKNGGRCLEGGLCRCLSDSYGEKCQFKTGRCAYTCKNGGACNQFNACTCPEGYIGKFCQKPVCSQDCGVKRLCVAPDVCQCKPWTKGPHCSKVIRPHARHNYLDRSRANMHKKTRKQRQSDASRVKKDHPMKIRKRMNQRKSLRHRYTNLNTPFRHSNLKNRKIIQTDYKKIRHNNNAYSYNSNYHDYKNRHSFNSNYNQNYPKIHHNFQRNKVNKNIHTNNRRKKKIEAYSPINNVRTDYPYPNNNNPNKYNKNPNDKRNSYYHNNHMNDNNDMRLKEPYESRLRTHRKPRKEGGFRLGKSGKRSQHKYRRKSKVYDYEKVNRIGKVNKMNKASSNRRSVKKKKQSQGKRRFTHSSYDNNKTSNRIKNKSKIKKINKIMKKNGHVNNKELRIKGRKNKSKRAGKKQLRSRMVGRLGRGVS